MLSVIRDKAKSFFVQDKESAMCMLIQFKVSKLPGDVQASGKPVTLAFAFIITATKSSSTFRRVSLTEPYSIKW